MKFNVNIYEDFRLKNVLRSYEVFADDEREAREIAIDKYARSIFCSLLSEVAVIVA